MIAERLRQLVDFKGKSSRDFALKIGSSSQVFGKYLQGRSPSYEVLNCIIETFDDISAEWLLTGKGEMIKTKSEETPAISLEILQSQQRTIENLSETIKNLTSK